MKFMTACTAFVSLSLLNNAEARRKKSPWAIERTQHVRDRMERTYGKGLVGMINPVTGRMDPERFGWDNRTTGGRKMGETISRTIADGTTIDASTMTAWTLGFVKGFQYNGLVNEGASVLPNDTAALTNCFATTYSLLTSFDSMAFSIETINDIPGTWKGFDAFVIGPTTILADSSVAFEMCEVNSILDQFKSMASLDWASLSDNLSRQVLVAAIEMPEAGEAINNVFSAAKCAAQKVKEEVEVVASENGVDGNAEGWVEFREEQANGSSDIFDFQADVATDAVADIAGDCVKLVDQFFIGEITGKVFTSFFNSELKPLA